MLSKEKLECLTEEERGALVFEVLGKAESRIRDVASTLSYLSEVSVNSMGIRLEGRECIRKLLKLTARVGEEEEGYYYGV